MCLLSVPGIRCGGCVASIERQLATCSDVVSARANLTVRRVSVRLVSPDIDPKPVIDLLVTLGYSAELIDQARTAGPDSAVGSELLRAVAVAGFGAMNVMLLSVAVWSGASGATRETFHLVSALIAVPVVAYSGQPFFRSALSGLRHRRLNMDVPITLAVILTLALSLFETARGGDKAFFDAAVSLLFFLLVGRYLDHLMRARARSAVAGLRRLAPRGASIRQDDGSLDYLPLEDIEPGMIVRIAPGERVPLDVRIARGATDLDRSLVTGEVVPVAAGPGDVLEAGTLNLTGEVDAVALRPADDSFLAAMARMLTAAEAERGAYVRIADRAARLYAPFVHLAALGTFVGWWFATGDWRVSVFVAISVLIITCPCALGLAVPVTHVVAAGRLMREGILMRDGTGLERLAEIDRVVLDKTGTLTTGVPVIAGYVDDTALSGARALAQRSLHPVARAIASLPGPATEARHVRELPGFGVEGTVGGRRARLGRANWVGEIAESASEGFGPAFALEGGPLTTFELTETLRPGAGAAVAALRDSGISVAVVSGDEAERVARIAAELGVDDYRAGATPAEKVAYLEACRAEGRRALMVGDGLNDAPALAAAHVSMAPANAADAGRSAADFVFLREGLDSVPSAHRIARAAARLIRQNFGLAVAYNCIAIPLAVAGQVTPLIAALAMSASSIVVIANSLRLNALPAADPADPGMALTAVPA